MANKMTQTEKKYKKFAIEFYSNGQNATKAYITVFKPKNEKTAPASASRLLKHVKVQAFMEEIEQAEVDRAIVTKEEIIQSNLDIRDEAKADKRYGDAIKANSEVARLTGMYEPDKVENKTEIKFDFGVDLEDED